MSFRKKEREKKPEGADPLSERTRALNEQIATLEAQIKKLDHQLQSPGSKPKLRSTTLPYGATAPKKPEPAPVPTPQPKPEEPVFEEIKAKAVPPPEEASPDRYNELGVRKYDLPALWNRIRNHFRGPATSNPRLVNYLAAGGVQGLRPLRYEKRVARNRFIFFAGGLFFLLLGIILLYLRSH
ncbi:MAG TPA: hypothetical protein VN625_03500 [Desulfuromonadaceae bacterium]|nr:hypothetical protein [Desulfuromonadaceae bacterium]